MVTKGLPAPQLPKIGFKQICSGTTDVSDEAIPNGNGPHTLANNPVKLASLTYTPGSGDPTIDFIVEVDRGVVRVLAAKTGILKIDYTALGREVTGEELATDPEANTEYRVKY